MSYLSVPPIDHGFVEFTVHSYGGFAYRADTLERQVVLGKSLPTDPTKRFITEHNLALFWRRPGLYPGTKAFPLPLIATTDDYASGVRNRPPGNIRVDCAPIRYRQRNLLAGELIEDDAIRIWTINDSSDHKQLLNYELKLVEPHSCNRTQLLRLERSEEEGPTGRMDLGSEVLQLKAFESADARSGHVFMRTKQSLELADTNECLCSQVFRSQIRVFTQIPHLDGELAVVDSQGMLFWGNVENPSSFTRFKLPTPIKGICQTDCPRILLSTSEKELRQLDLRDSGGRSSGQLLFSQSPIQPADGPLSDHFYESLTARDQLCHVHPLDVELETVLLTSTRRHLLIDRRMPGQALVTMAHAEIDGADYCLTTPSFVDPRSGGRVFSLYSLSQVKKPVVSHWAVMFHPKEALWSSLGPKYELDSPHSAISQFVQLHADMPQLDLSRLPKYTRAIHYQSLNLHLPISSTRAILFRQMDGGELWYENVFFDPLPKLRQSDQTDLTDENEESDEDYCELGQIDELKLKKRSLEQLSAYQMEQNAGGKWVRPHFFREIQEELFLSRSSEQSEQINVSSLEIASEFDNLMSNQPANHHTDPFANVHRICDGASSDAEQPFSIGEDKEGGRKMLSSCIDKMWQKTLALWNEAKEKRVQKELGLMDIGEEDDEENEEEHRKEKERARMKVRIQQIEADVRKEMKREERRKRKREMTEGEGSGVGGGRREEDEGMDEAEGPEEGDEDEEREMNPNEEGGKPIKGKAESEDDDDYDFEVNIDE